MRNTGGFRIGLALLLVAGVAPTLAVGPVVPGASPRTRVSLVDRKWRLNGVATYRGTTAEGLLMNVRMVNAGLEDANDPTRPQGFDPEANTDAFIAKIPDYVANGVRAFTLCLQGGHCGDEGAVNPAFNPSTAGPGGSSSRRGPGAGLSSPSGRVTTHKDGLTCRGFSWAWVAARFH